jgi:hypothetical protein
VARAVCWAGVVLGAARRVDVRLWRQDLKKCQLQLSIVLRIWIIMDAVLDYVKVSEQSMRRSRECPPAFTYTPLRCVGRLVIQAPLKCVFGHLNVAESEACGLPGLDRATIERGPTPAQEVIAFIVGCRFQ